MRMVDAATVASKRFEVRDGGRSYRAKHGLSSAILFVSDNLTRYELLIQAALDTTIVVPIKYATWSMADLKAAVDERVPPDATFDAVGFIDHGEPGEFCLLKSVAGGAVSLADLEHNVELASFFKEMAGYVKSGGRIDLMACEVAAGPSGKALLAHLEALTKVKVTASIDKTGTASKGGNWVMESSAIDVVLDYFVPEKLLKWNHVAGPAAAAAAAIGLGIAGNAIWDGLKSWRPFG